MGKPEALPSRAKTQRSALPKAPTGISGLDEITLGGLPRGRPTLVCGAAGCGKTLLAMEFLLRGAEQYGEHGVFMPVQVSIPMPASPIGHSEPDKPVFPARIKGLRL